MKQIIIAISTLIVPLFAAAQQTNFQYFTAEGKAYYKLQSQIPFNDVKIFTDYDGGKIVKEFTNPSTNNLLFEMPIESRIGFAGTNFSNVYHLQPILFNLQNFTIDAIGNNLIWHATTTHTNTYSFIVEAGNDASNLLPISNKAFNENGKNNLGIAQHQYAYYRLSIKDNASEQVLYKSTILNNPNIGNVYPTKALDFVNLISFYPNTNYTLINSQGIVLQQGKCVNERQTINTSKLPSGMYFVKLNTETQNQSFTIIK